MGKRKIPMTKIENDQYRMVSFSKRRKGLFKKAEELSALTGARTAVFVVSQAGRPFASAAGSDLVEKFLSDGDEGTASGDIAGLSLIGELLSVEVTECEGFEELLALKENLVEMRERVCLALDLQFVSSLLD